MDGTDTQSIEEKICSIVREELKLPREALTAQTQLRELPGVESIKILRIVAHLERAYDVELEDEVVFRVKTVAELAEAIRKMALERRGVA
jgi:acyl carrier protein